MEGVGAAASHPAVLGEFQIRGVLGEGGSSTVYDAEWGHRRVALKVLRQELLPTDRERQRFLSEARIAQAVDHPGVVRVLGSGSLEDGRPYLVMEHLAGESLAHRVARGPLALREALELLDQIAAAVSALHERGLIHRDIKLENVILSGRHAVLLDFGIAKAEAAAASTITQEGSLRGTPAYMAPERFFGAQASTATDVYELAVLFYVMAAGRLPWSNVADPAARLNPPRPTELGVPLPTALETELLRALSTRSEARPASVLELARRLRDGAGTGGTQAAPTSAPDLRLTADLESGPVGGVARGGGLAPAMSGGARNTVQGKRSRSLLFGVGALVVLGFGITLILLLRDDPREAPADAPAAAGEVADQAVAPPPKDTPAPEPVILGAPEELWKDAVRQPSKATAQVLALYPADTLLVLAVDVGALRDSAIVKGLLEQNAKTEAVRYLGALDLMCGFDVFGSLDEVTVGTSGGEDLPVEATFRGRLARPAVEKCLALFLAEDGGEVAEERHGQVTRLSSGKLTLWLGWTRSGTLFVSTRKGADVAWMEGRLASKTGPVLLAPLLERIDFASALWLVATPQSKDTKPLVPGTKPPESVYLSMRVATRIDLHAGLRFAEAADAEEAGKALEAQLRSLLKDPFAGAWLKDAGFGVTGTDVVFHAWMDEVGAKATVQAIVGML